MSVQRRNLDLATALEDARARYVADHPKSLERFRAAQAVMPGGNTRAVLHYAPFPFTVTRGAGARIWDADGHEYGDFLGEYTAGLYGHNHPILEQAIIEALKGGIVLGGPNMIEAEFARAMCDRFASVERIRFTNSGTELNLMALGAARAFTGRQDILVMNGAYHGGVLSFETNGPINAPFPFHFTDYNDAGVARDKILGLGDRLAAVIVEPMVGAGGGMPGTPEFLGALRDVATRTGAVLIFDEVMSSRHTAGGLQGYRGITPDLTSFGKYLGGGLTFGAFGGRAEIMDHFDPARDGAWGHAGTFNNNILTMAAGHAGLSRIYTPEVADRFFEAGNAFRAALAADLDRLDVPISFAGLGSMMVFHFHATPPAKPLLGAEKPPKELLELLHLDMIERGQFYARRGMINLSLATTTAEMAAFRTAFAAVVEARAPLIRSVIGAR